MFKVSLSTKQIKEALSYVPDISFAALSSPKLFRIFICIDPKLENILSLVAELDGRFRRTGASSHTSALTSVTCSGQISTTLLGEDV